MMRMCALSIMAFENLEFEVISYMLRLFVVNFFVFTARYSTIASRHAGRIDHGFRPHASQNAARPGSRCRSARRFVFCSSVNAAIAIAQRAIISASVSSVRAVSSLAADTFASSSIISVLCSRSRNTHFSATTFEPTNLIVREGVTLNRNPSFLASSIRVFTLKTPPRLRYFQPQLGEVAHLAHT